MMTLEQRLCASVALEVMLAKLVTTTMNECLALQKLDHTLAEMHRSRANAIRGQILDHFHTAARGGDPLG